MTTQSAGGGAVAEAYAPRITRINGRMVRLLREQRGLGCPQLAERVGIHRGHLNKIENGVQHGSALTRWRIAEALGVELDAITYTEPRQRRRRPAA